MKHSTPTPEITAAMNTIHDGLAKRDARTVAAAYARDALLYNLAPPLAHTFDVQQLAKWLDGWGGPVEQETKDFEFDVSGDLAFGHGLIHVSTRTKAGENVAWWMRATVCLRRENGGWKIVHEHTSVPFYMDGSFRAAIDLSP